MYFLTFDGKILSLLLLYESVTPAKDNTLLRKRGGKKQKKISVLIYEYCKGPNEKCKD